MSYQYGRNSEDSARPLSNVNYSQAGSGANKEAGAGYGSGYSAGNSYPVGSKQGKKKKPWLWIILGIVALIVILGATLGGVFGSRASKNNAATSDNDNAGGSSGAAAATGTKTAGSAKGAVVPTGTDAWGNPLYPTTTGSALISAPTVVANSKVQCAADTYKAPSSGSLAVRPDHPVLIASANKWACLPELIAADSYMASWNKTIFENATMWYDADPVAYVEDGGLSGSGVLDPAREVLERIYHWGYAYKLSNDTKWVDRAWKELQVASGNSTTQSFGAAGNNWNTAHFLDVGEFTAAFAYGYDWFYDAWTTEQKDAIRSSIITLGLSYGLKAYTDANSGYSWWTKVNGNWNCVCNSGLTLGALAILNDDTTGIAEQVLSHTVPNALANCVFGPSSDGTWSETANYWYFGSYAHARMAASLLSATGSTHNMMDANPGMALSGDFHMYITGMQGLFAYGDTGPNKYSANANLMMFYGSQFKKPQYTLFQRDRADSAEPHSMLYYDINVSGDFWDGLPLDHHFDNTTDGWASMRSSWTTTEGLYVAMKAGALEGHQTHGDLDVGDFVLDALGQRWAGEYGSGDYLANNYFSNETQGSERWYYYRKRTEGQNTVVLYDSAGLDQNQDVSAVPSTTFGTTGEAQDALVYTPAKTSTAFFTANMESAYGTPAERAIRTLNGRKQVLLQDEITVPSGQTLQWRMQTNATVTMSNNNQTATLELGGKTLIAQLLSPSTGAFYTQAPVRSAADPTLQSDSLSQDQDNAPAQVLTIMLPSGEQNIQVLFNPQWDGMQASDFVSPPSVPIASWSTTSHN